MSVASKKKLVVLPLLAAAVAGWYVFSRHSADNGDGAEYILFTCTGAPAAAFALRTVAAVGLPCVRVPAVRL